MKKILPLLIAILCLGAAAPLPNVALDVKQITQAVTPNPAQLDRNPRTQNAPVNQSSIYYIITLTNLSNIAAKDVVINYDIYQQSISTVGANTTTKVDEITGSETEDVSANSNKTIETSKILNIISQAPPQNQNRLRQPPNGTLNIKQNILGIWVEAKIGNTTVAFFEKPRDIRATMQAKAAPKADDDFFPDMDKF